MIKVGDGLRSALRVKRARFGLARLHAKLTALSNGDWLAGSEQGEVPMPSPWAAAVGVLALLAFGVLVGSNFLAGDGAASPVVLAAAPLPAASQPALTHQTTAAAAPPAAPSEAETPATSESAETPAPAETTTAKPAPAREPPKKTGKQPPANATDGAGATPSAALPPIKHVFLIVLSDGSFGTALAAGSPAPYLAGTLRKQGELVQSYYAVSGGELANTIALISGQGPTAQTAADCPLYANVAPASATAHGQVLGSGCVYPATTLTIADQLTAQGDSWRAYIEGLAAPGQPTSCAHPALGAEDAAQPTAADPYVTWRNPFVYFHSLTDVAACTSNDVGLEQLASDLKSIARTPSLAFIAPSPCDDGSPQPCAPGQPAGLAPADAFLSKVVPQIEASAAYKQDGLIAITFDQAPQSGPQADSRGCCLSDPYPNLAPTATSASSGPAGTTTTSDATSTGAQTGSTPGGGQVGLLLISRYVKPGSEILSDEYDHFSLLASIESLFGLQPLGYAATPGLLTFDKSVYSAYK